MLGRIRSLVVLLVLAAIPLQGNAADWVCPGLNTNQPVWDLQRGLFWVVAPAGFRGREPRGLIRLSYWRSQRPIPGGIAFENFELVERFRNGQTSVFGITRQTPQELGFKQ